MRLGQEDMSLNLDSCCFLIDSIIALSNQLSGCELKLWLQLIAVVAQKINGNDTMQTSERT